MISKFKALGWDGPIQARQHAFMAQGTRKVRSPNPHGSDISRGLLAEILRQARISVEDWEAA